MKKIAFIIFICANLINISESCAQLKSLYDFKYNKFNIGFRISVNPNIATRIALESEDSLTNIVLFDSLLSESEELIFIFQNVFEEEKIYYPNNKVYPIFINNTGVYYIDVNYRQKFLLVK